MKETLMFDVTSVTNSTVKENIMIHVTGKEDEITLTHLRILRELQSRKCISLENVTALCFVSERRCIMIELIS
jgi:hypothetical protein